jgi:putative ABC transport system substrate-binding protein
MRRREFITLLGGVAAAWPLTARAQQGERKRRIGVLIGRPETDSEGQGYVAAFQQGLEQLGWMPGRNVEIDYRWTAGNASLAQAVAEELIALRPDILVVNSTAALLAARQAAGALPIVVAAIADPVAQGFVPSLVRPGGNITGFAVEEPVMGAKWVELLKEIAPHVGHITVIFNPSSAPFARMFLPSMEGVRTSFSLEANRFPHSQ